MSRQLLMTARHRRPLTARERRHRRFYPLVLALGVLTGLAIPPVPLQPQPPLCQAPTCQPDLSVPTPERY